MIEAQDIPQDEVQQQLSSSENDQLVNLVSSIVDRLDDNNSSSLSSSSSSTLTKSESSLSSIKSDDNNSINENEVLVEVPTSEILVVEVLKPEIEATEVIEPELEIVVEVAIPEEITKIEEEILTEVKTELTTKTIDEIVKPVENIADSLKLNHRYTKVLNLNI